MPTSVSPSLLRRYSQVFPVGSAGARFPAMLKERRRAHLEALDGFALFAGVPREPGSENLWMMNALRIFQEPSVMFLTGVNQPQVVLALVPAAASGKGRHQEILFVPGKNPEREFWDGVRFGLPPAPQGKDRGKGGVDPKRSQDADDIRALTGVEDVRPLEEFEPWLRAQVKASKKNHGYVFYHHYDDGGRPRVTRTDHNYAFKQTVEREARRARPDFKIRPCAALHYHLRLPLDADQARDVAKAVDVTREAFLETARALGAKGPDAPADENALGAHLQHGMLRRSPFGLAFPSIIASGRNACTLHYLKNDEPLDPKGLVLMDFGARWGTMHADITRVLPVNGRFNPLQALIYQIVLDAAKENERNAKPGATIRQLNDKVWTFLENALQERFFAKGGKAERAYKGKPHGVSHLMGEQEHDGDPHRLYQDHPLQPGWQISNEPGLYGRFTITLEGKRWSEWIGIRVEDDLLITTKGCKNLSAAIPREIREIEALMAPA